MQATASEICKFSYLFIKRPGPLSAFPQTSFLLPGLLKGEQSGVQVIQVSWGSDKVKYRKRVDWQNPSQETVYIKISPNHWRQAQGMVGKYCRACRCQKTVAKREIVKVVSRYPWEGHWNPTKKGYNASSRLRKFHVHIKPKPSCYF